jgi:hypothetical protein
MMGAIAAVGVLKERRNGVDYVREGEADPRRSSREVFKVETCG